MVFHSKSSVEKGEKLAAKTNGSAYIRADLSNESDTRRLISEVLALYGRLDVLVNNAGINAVIPHGSLTQATPAIWRALYEVNVVAPWTLISEAEPALRA